MSGLRYHLQVARAVAVRDFKIRITYIPWILNSLVQPVVWTLILVYAYKAIMGPGSMEALRGYGWRGDPVSFLIAGQVMLSLFNALNWRAGMAVQRERWYGTLEIVFLTPASRVVMLFGSSIYGLLDAGWVSFIAVVTLYWLTGAGFTVADPLAAAVSLAAAVLGALAMGVGLAGVYVLTRSAGPLAVAIQHPLRFLTGSSFPLGVLPVALQYAAYAIPLTYGLRAVRMTVIEGAGLDRVAGILAPLLLVSLAAGVLGVLFVRWAEEVAKRNGWLHTF